MTLLFEAECGFFSFIVCNSFDLDGQSEEMFGCKNFGHLHAVLQIAMFLSLSGGSFIFLRL